MRMPAGAVCCRGRHPGMGRRVMVHGVPTRRRHQRSTTTWLMQPPADNDRSNPCRLLLYFATAPFSHNTTLSDVIEACGLLTAPRQVSTRQKESANRGRPQMAKAKSKAIIITADGTGGMTEIQGSLVISGVCNYLFFQANKAYPAKSRWIRWNKCVTFRIP